MGDVTSITKDAAESLRLATASDQARAIASGKITSASLINSESRATDLHQPQLNAFVQRADKPGQSIPGLANNSVSALSGTSFSIKDNIDASGYPTRAGLAVLPATPSASDATVVARLKQAGLVFGGKLNMSPMALGSTTHNEDFGHCYNPLREGYSAGGSSGGSASAVAAGITGIALGTDTMGSVRLPAAFCGIVGFKPSWGQLSVEGVVPLCEMLDHVGVLCRSVEDASHAFNIMRDDYSAPSVFATTAFSDHKPAPSVLGVVENMLPLALQADVERSYKLACKQLRAAGYILEAIDATDWQLSTLRRAGLIVSEAELLNTLVGVYPEKSSQLPADLLAMLQYIDKQPAKRVGRAMSQLAHGKRHFLSLYDHIDALVLPTTPHTAFSMSGELPVNSADFTVIANLLGAPAISLPLPAASSDLPAGLQIVGEFGNDNDLLALAACVESVLN